MGNLILHFFAAPFKTVSATEANSLKTTKALPSKTTVMKNFSLSIFTFLFAVASQVVNAQVDRPLSNPNYFNTKTLGWSLAPSSLPEGAKISLLHGDPSKVGPFTLRLELPAHYRVAAHTHPGLEHVTVIEGVFYIGLGTEFDADAVTVLKRGGFITLEAGQPHFAYTKTKTIIQLHGTGPWDLEYINRADDPRKMKER